MLKFEYSESIIQSHTVNVNGIELDDMDIDDIKKCVHKLIDNTKSRRFLQMMFEWVLKTDGEEKSSHGGLIFSDKLNIEDDELESYLMKKYEDCIDDEELEESELKKYCNNKF